MWKIVDYFPESLVSCDFCHPFFPEDVWFLRLDAPSSPYVTSNAIVILTPKAKTSTKIGVKIEWEGIKKPIMCTMVDPSVGAIAAKKEVIDGFESMIGSTFSIKVILFYPSGLFEGGLEEVHEGIVDDVKRLLLDPSFREDTACRDFTLVSSDGKSIRVHGLLLSAKSSVMRAMLGMESSQEKKNRKMILKETPFHVLHRFVEYVYSDNIDYSSMDVKEAIDLLIFADQYDIPSLKKSVEGFIACNIQDEYSARIANEVISKIDSTAIEGAVIRFLSSSSTPFPSLSTELVSQTSQPRSSGS
jgi:hypothetical protein